MSINYNKYYKMEIGWLNNAGTIDDLNKAWDDVRINLGIELDEARNGYKYDRAHHLEAWKWGNTNLTSIYERRMNELGGTPYPEDYMKIGDTNPKTAPDFKDYENAQKADEENRKARNEVTSLNEQAHAIANRRTMADDKGTSNRNPRIPGGDSSQTMLTGRDRGRPTMLTRGYQPRTLMGG